MTFLFMMGLFPEPNGIIVKGRIILEGTDLTKLSENELCKIRGKDISMIFQEPMTSLNPVLTIGEQIIEVITYHQEVSRNEARKIGIEMLEKVRFFLADKNKR